MLRLAHLHYYVFRATLAALATIALGNAAANAQQNDQATISGSATRLVATGRSPAVAHSTPAPRVGPHGGQWSNSNGYEFEVVYLPRETRVYMYDASHRPVGSRALRGEVTMQVHGNNQVQRFVLQPTSASSQDYLVAGIDVSRIPDGSMDASFLITAANWQANQGIRFSQEFAHTHLPLTVAIATLTPADRAAINTQKTCPVTGEDLDSMGGPIKLLVGDTPLFVCCKGCINKVKQNPEVYLQKISRSTVPVDHSATQMAVHTSAGSAKSFAVTLAALTDADRPAIAAQGVCPVTGEKLGSMGAPVKLLVGDTPLFVCCKGCIQKVQQNPQEYLQKVSHESAATRP